MNEVFKHLYIHYHPMISVMVLKNSGSQEEADDVFQESIIALHRQVKQGRFEGKSSIKTYLYSIGKNLWIRQLSKINRHVALDMEKLEKSAYVDSLLTSNEKLRGLLAKLDEACNRLLTEYYLMGISHQVIMGRFNLGSVDAARNKKHRCMKKLMDIIKSGGFKKSDFLD